MLRLLSNRVRVATLYNARCGNVHVPEKVVIYPVLHVGFTMTFEDKSAGIPGLPGPQFYEANDDTLIKVNKDIIWCIDTETILKYQVFQDQHSAKEYFSNSSISEYIDSITDWKCMRYRTYRVNTEYGRVQFALKTVV